VFHLQVRRDTCYFKTKHYLCRCLLKSIWKTQDVSCSQQSLNVRNVRNFKFFILPSLLMNAYLVRVNLKCELFQEHLLPLCPRKKFGCTRNFLRIGSYIIPICNIEVRVRILLFCCLCLYSHRFTIFFLLLQAFFSWYFS